MGTHSTEAEAAMSPRLPASLRAWNTEDFLQVLKAEMRKLDSGVLPLFEGTTQGGQVDDSDIAITLLNASRNEAAVWLDVGVFFSEIVGGCSCGDDPVAGNAYCELRIRIDRATATADFRSLS